MTAMAVGAVVRICCLSQAFGQPSIKLSDHGETGWSFGQLLSMLILIFPLVSVVEIYRGELHVASCANEKRGCAYDGELQRQPQQHDPFQPSPFFGSQTNLFSKSTTEYSRAK